MYVFVLIFLPLCLKNRRTKQNQQRCVPRLRENIKFSLNTNLHFYLKMKTSKIVRCQMHFLLICLRKFLSVYNRGRARSCECMCVRLRMTRFPMRRFFQCIGERAANGQQEGNRWCEYFCVFSVEADYFYTVSLLFQPGEKQQLTSKLLFWILKKLLFNTLVASNWFV